MDKIIISEIVAPDSFRKAAIKGAGLSSSLQSTMKKLAASNLTIPGFNVSDSFRKAAIESAGLSGSLQRTMKKLAASNLYMNELGVSDSVRKAAIESAGLSSSLQSVMKKFAVSNISITGLSASDSVCKAAIESAGFSSSLLSVIEKFSVNNLSITELSISDSVRKAAMESATLSSSLQSAMEKFSVSSLTVSGLSVSDSLRNAAMESASLSNSLQSVMEKLAVPANFEATLNATNFSFPGSDASVNNEDIAEQLGILEASNDPSAYAEQFRRLPLFVQKYFWNTFFYLLAVSIGIFNPEIRTLIIEVPDKPRREQIKEISITRIDALSLWPQRFVSADILHLREQPKIGSVSLDELKFGQVITVISKRRNWLKVTYRYDDGEVMQGWVFTRYTERFRR